MKEKASSRLKLAILLGLIFLIGIAAAYTTQIKKSFLCFGRTNCSEAPKGVCVKGGACLN